MIEAATEKSKQEVKAQTKTSGELTEPLASEQRIALRLRINAQEV